MAVIIERRTSNGDDNLIWPVGPLDSENWARGRRGEKALARLGGDLRDKRFMAELAAGKTRFNARVGVPRNEISYRRPPEYFPAEMELNYGPLYDYNAVPYDRGGPVVSARMRKIIEQHEPADDGFQFQPVPILAKDGSLVADDYLFWDVYRRVDAINPASKSSLVAPMDMSLGNHVYNTPGNLVDADPDDTGDKFSLFSSVIAGISVWCDIRLGLNSDHVFVSDALFADLMAAGITGVGIKAAWAEV